MNRTQGRSLVLGRGRGLLVLALLIGVLSTQMGLASLAYYTTSAASNGNTFVAGSIELDLTDGNETDQDSISASIAASVAGNSWRPGQKVAGPITVKNSGSLGLTYGLGYTAADSGTTPDGASATPTQFLSLTIKAKGTGNGAAGDCTTALFGDVTKWQETVVAATTLSTAGATLLADTARTLAAGSSEALCVQAEFVNSGTGGTENAGMGGTSTMAFSFNGRQQ